MKQRALLGFLAAEKVHYLMTGVSQLETSFVSRSFQNRKHLLPDIASQFQKLRQEGYWIHASIVETALREAGET